MWFLLFRLTKISDDFKNVWKHKFIINIYNITYCNKFVKCNKIVPKGAWNTENFEQYAF